MISKFSFSATLSVALLSLLSAISTQTGCDRSTSESGLASDHQHSVIRRTFWSDTPLAGQAKTPTEIKEAASESGEAREVLIAGRIDAGEFTAFGKGEATFILSQLPDDAHGGDDPNHADNCPFCKRKLKNAPKAIVRFEDSEGEVIAVAVDQLFGLTEKDIVLVQGQARYDKLLNSVLVKATKLSRK